MTVAGADSQSRVPNLRRRRVRSLDQPAFSRWLYALIPVSLVLLVVFFLPLWDLIETSFHPNGRLGRVGPGYTLDNYTNFFSDTFYLGILGRTLWIGVVTVVICMVMAYPVAYLIARTRSRWRNVLIYLVVAPLLISLVIRTVGWFPVIGDSGMVNWALLGLHLIDEPLHITNSFTAVVLGLVQTQLPFMIIMLTTVIQRIEPEIEEAARSLGSHPLRTFWHVVLPLSRPGLLAGGLLVFTMSFSAYTTPAMLGGPRVLVMSTYIAQQILTVLNYPFGATVSVVLLVVAGAVSLLSVFSAGKQR